VRAKGLATPFLLVVTTSLAVFLLVGSTSNARQKPEVGSDKLVVVSQEALREVASELSLLRESLHEDVARLEREYIQACQNRVRAGGPKDEAIAVDLDKQRKNYERLVEQLKGLQDLAERD